MRFKRVIAGFLAAGMIVCSAICPDVADLFSVTASAENLVDGDYEYTVSNGRATITKYIGTDTDVTIPNELGGCVVEAIAAKAFAQNDKIVSVVIPYNVHRIGDLFSSYYIGSDGAFADCTSLKSVVFPPSLSIAPFTFYNCTSLTEVTLTENVSMISPLVFSNCCSLERVNVDASSSDYSSVDGVLYSKDGSKLIFYPGGKKQETFVVPDTVKIIDQNSFYAANNASLKKIVISKNVYGIDYCAFADCGSITAFEVSSSNSHYTSSDGVLYRRSGDELVCCPAQKAGSTFDIPYGVTEIAAGAFVGCGFSEIKIPDTVQIIRDVAFGSTQIEELIIPSSVTELNYFGWCYNLKRLYIPESVTSITAYSEEESAFEYCWNLTIYGVKGSYAETYAKKYNIPFIAGMFSDTPEDTAVSGTITVSGDTEAVAGTTMSIKNSDGTACGAEIEIAEDGTFTVTGILPDGDYTITANKSKCCPRDYTVTIEDGQMTGELNVELQLYGDIDNNGIVTLDDVIDVINYFNKKTSAISSADKGTQDYLIAVSDVDGDGVIKLDDAIEMINYFNKKASAFDKIA